MTAATPFEIGIFTFGELTRNAEGKPMDAATRMRDILEWARVADEAGLDVFGVGEHHREDSAVSSPPVVLAAAAARTKSIRLTSTVTVLSSADPVRVFEDFATLDLISQGRRKSPPDAAPTWSPSRSSDRTSSATTSTSMTGSIYC